MAVINGTAALFAACAVVGIGPGDEVIMPSFTIISCALAIHATGAKPVLVDCDPATWCMNPEEVAARITPATRAIMLVHIYGHPVDVDPIRDVADRYGLLLIEDAAEAHGAEYKGVRAGALGDIACFSFYANKIITTGEGGMVVTNDEQLAARVRDYRNLAFRQERRFLHTEVGHNYRLTNVQAAIGVAQLETVDARVQRKRQIGQLYNSLLTGIPGLSLPVERPWAHNVYWVYGLVLDEETGYDAVSFAAELHGRGVDTRPFFLGMHRQPILHDQGLFDGEEYPVTDRIAAQGLYVPSGLAITDSQIGQVADVVKEVLR